MGQLASTLLVTTLAGASLAVGGLLARIERLRPRWLEQEFRHGVLAFGGGILLAAVALVLVPHSTRELAAWEAIAGLVAGGVVFLLVDRQLALQGKQASNLIAALLDFAPEAVALGALISSDPSLGLLLAGFIALQNLPEGFNAYRELVAGNGMPPSRSLLLLAAAGLVGPVCGLLGFWLLAEAPRATAATMIFAAGGILYLIFQDIAPQAKLARHWIPPLGAVLGFALGLIGTMLTGN